MSHELRLGDCLDPVSGLPSLADKSVAHVVADPPYESEAHTLQRRIYRRVGKERVLAAAPLGFDPIGAQERFDVAAQMVRVCRGWLVVFCQAEGIGLWRAAFEEAGAAWRRSGIWLKPDGMPQLTGDRPAQVFESLACAWAGKGKSRWNGGGRGGVYTCPTHDFGRLYRPGERPHPTVKPLALMEQLVRDFTDPGELICDPFAGSCTTGAACKRLGRSFLGWEIDPGFYEVGRKRLDAAREQFQLPRMTRPKQLPLSGPEKEGAA